MKCSSVTTNVKQWKSFMISEISNKNTNCKLAGRESDWNIFEIFENVFKLSLQT